MDNEKDIERDNQEHMADDTIDITPNDHTQNEAQVLVEHQPLTQTVIAKEAKPKKDGFWQRYKGTIAVALICSLGGGLVGGALVSLNQPKQTQLRLPSGQAPISITGGEISPVVAIAKAVSPAVVGITNKGTVQDFFGRQYAAERGTGSGVIFSADGYIVTNNHVIEGATSLLVRREIDRY